VSEARESAVNDPVEKRIGRYTILREIASGGMATVFLARLDDAGVSRTVAIKRLHPHLATEEEFVSMFFEEAQVAARIRHPNVVETLEIDDIEGLSIVMEYVEGPTLLQLAKDQARRGSRLPLGTVARIANDLLAGLHAAHELCDEKGASLGLVHRDVSPHNVIVGLDGRARITDFGIARATGRVGATRDGQTKGKLAYMSPEQLLADELDRRADVFAAGIVLWELLTGRRLFAGSSDARVIHALLHEEIPSPREYAPELPAGLDAVLMTALARAPESRWPTCEVFSRALMSVLPLAPHTLVAALAARAEATPSAAPAGRIQTPPSAVRRVSRRTVDPEMLQTVVDPPSRAPRAPHADATVADPDRSPLPPSHPPPLRARDPGPPVAPAPALDDAADVLDIEPLDAPSTVEATAAPIVSARTGVRVALVLAALAVVVFAVALAIR
jgi:serine/threonine-protein kinase